MSKNAEIKVEANYVRIEEEKAPRIRKIDVNKIDLDIVDVEFWGSNPRNQGGIEISWVSKIGFGTCIIYKGGDNVLYLDSECMDVQEDKEFTEKLLSLLAQKLIVEG